MAYFTVLYLAKERVVVQLNHLPIAVRFRCVPLELRDQRHYPRLIRSSNKSPIDHRASPLTFALSRFATRKNTQSHSLHRTSVCKFRIAFSFRTALPSRPHSFSFSFLSPRHYRPAASRRAIRLGLMHGSRS